MDNKALIDELLELSDPKLDNKIIDSFKVKDSLCKDIFEKNRFDEEYIKEIN